MPPSHKVQRWLDLIATLLAHRSPVTFDQLEREVPGYGGDLARASKKRTFERDKLELRALGVPLETLGDEGDEEAAYRLRTKDFYLPYLAFMRADGQVEAPQQVGRYGYHSLPQLSFGIDELRAISDAAALARQLGDPALAGDVDAAMRKLAFDLPLDAAAEGPDHVILAQGPRARAQVLQVLGEALVARKRVTFTYHAMGSDAVEERTVAPYGLFFLNGHWYLAGHDAGRDALRNFRVSRIERPVANAAKALTHDYEIPGDFDLRAHARSRHPWELGDGERIEAIVEVTGGSGATRAAALLGEPVPGDDARRRFTVRRPDAFARWILSFAGEMRVVSPPQLAATVREIAHATARLYDAELPEVAR
ncbi:MAG: helix-turn-helix transcriptional regulator [Gemmatimonadaceae bacterium]